MKKTGLKIKESYMLLIPNNFKGIDAKPVSLGKVKDAPYFFELDIECKLTHEETIDIDGAKVKIEYQNIDGEVILAEANFDLSDNLDDSTIVKKTKIVSRIREHILTGLKYKGEFTEEYSTTFISGIKEKPQDFVNQNKFFIARLIRSIKENINTNEVEEILLSKLSYSEEDMTIIDWEGAVVIGENEDDIDSDMSLVKIANYQLLRYRVLDQTIDDSVQDLRMFFNKKRKWLSDKKIHHDDILKTKIELLLDFERIDQFLLFIGDWYSAKLYRMIYDELYLDQWRNLVKEKISSLSEIYQTLSEKYSVSWNRLGENIQLIGWLILLAGYFVLLYLEFNAV